MLGRSRKRRYWTFGRVFIEHRVLRRHQADLEARVDRKLSKYRRKVRFDGAFIHSELAGYRMIVKATTH
jgi:hypothetical protein